METGVVDQPWALQLPLSSAASLGHLRREPDLQIGVAGESVWLRGPALDDTLRKRLLSLPATNRYTENHCGTLTAWGRITPAGKLPTVAWTALHAWGELTLPALGWPAERPSGLRLTLIRDTIERPCAALLMPWATWSAYAEIAPHVRLDALTFALNGERQAIVRGLVLPALPGVRLVEEHGILTPAGLHWAPAVAGEIVRKVLELQEGESAYWPSSDCWHRIPADAWVKATRSAVRVTAQEVSRV